MLSDYQAVRDFTVHPVSCDTMKVFIYTKMSTILFSLKKQKSHKYKDRTHAAILERGCSTPLSQYDCCIFSIVFKIYVYHNSEIAYLSCIWRLI